jgi:hypothetical protein
VLASADRPWSYRLSGVYELPYQVSLSGTWMYQAGAPEDTAVQVTNQTITLPQGNQTVRVREFGIDIFNATNESTISAWVTQLGPTYHRPSTIQRARLIKVGLNIEFYRLPATSYSLAS